MGALIDSLGNPDTSSSLVPLLIVTTILVVAFLAAFVLSLVKIWQVARRTRARLVKEKAMGGSPTQSVAGTALVASILHEAISPEKRADPLITQSELDELRKQIERLEHENSALREQHGNAIGRIDELEGMISSLEALRSDDKKLLEIETQRRLKVEANAASLEKQIKEIIHEVEKIYQQNAQVADIHSLGERIGELLRDAATPNPALEKRIAEQEEEIRQLKSVLSAARAQLVEMAGQSVKTKP